MAPLQLTKKTTSITAQATSRRGTRQVKQKVETYEEVTNDDDVETLEDEDLADDASNDTSQEPSQPNPVQQLLRNMQADVRLKPSPITNFAGTRND